MTQNMKFDWALSIVLALALAANASAQTPADEAGYPSTGPISGYMDSHVNNPEAADATIDFHRFVLIFNHSFSSRIR